MSDKTPKRRTTTIQRSLLLNMSLLIVLISGPILVTTYVVRVRQAVEDGATARIRGTADAAEKHLEQLFDGINRQLFIARSWGESQLLSIDNTDRHLEAIFQPVLERNPAIASVMIGNDEGNGWMLRRADEPRGNIDSDPRTRTWYQGAINMSSPEGIYWTSPYTTTTSQPRMTASAYGNFDGNGERESVIAFDIRLESVSDFTSSLYIGGRGRLIVINDNDEVIGRPGGMDEDVAFMTPAQELPVPELATAIQVWVDEVGRRSEFFRFESGDERWWGGIRYYNIGTNRRLAMAVVVPEQDFRAKANVWRNTIILITLGALAVAVLMASLLARRYSRPLAALAVASRQMRIQAESKDTAEGSAGGSGKTFKVRHATSPATPQTVEDVTRAIQTSRIREIDALAEDFEDMATQVENKSRQLEEYSHTLEHKVEERTDDLNKKNIELLEILAELQETQQQLILQEKMASLGNLVAGVAHEVNNPIGAVNGAANVATRCIERMRSALDNDADGANSADFQKAMRVLTTNNDIIIEGGRRVGELVKSLKNFSRLDEAEEQLADIHEGIESTLTLAEHLLKSGIEVVKEYGEIPQVMCYPNELNQVFMNVLVNASQAIDGKGRITIKTAVEGDNIHISVSDTGIGMKPEVVEQIFDPGFTTKGVGVGTGLGLPISHRIIDKHKGSIRATSEPSVATTIHIMLPIRGKDA